MSMNKRLNSFSAYWRGDTTGPLISVVTEPKYRQLFDHLHPNLEAVADGAASCIRADLAAGDPNVLPTVYCDFGTISTAKLYGGKVIPPPEGGMVHIHPVVKEPTALVDLTACPFEQSDFQLAVDLHRMVCERLGTDEVFLRTPDFQGPMNTLALVMDQQELLVGMYTEPDAIHAALESITTTLIDYHQRLRRELGGEMQRVSSPRCTETSTGRAAHALPPKTEAPGKVIGSIWPYTFLPEELGASITQDMMPLLSPELYRDFEIPQLKRIAEAFGGVQIHCCGRYLQHLPALKDSGITIRGLEFHHPFTPFTEIHKVFGDDIVYIPYLFGECKDYPDYVALAADLLTQGTPETRFWFAQARGWCDEENLKRTVRK